MSFLVRVVSCMERVVLERTQNEDPRGISFLVPFAISRSPSSSWGRYRETRPGRMLYEEELSSPNNVQVFFLGQRHLKMIIFHGNILSHISLVSFELMIIYVRERDRQLMTQCKFVSCEDKYL